MKRGYFDDFKDLKETQGRMFQPSEQLSPPGTSPHLPALAVCSVVRTSSFSLKYSLLCEFNMWMVLLCKWLDPRWVMVCLVEYAI